MEGTPDGFWNVLDSTDAINGVYVFPPTLLVSPFSLINVLIKGTISVESRTDIDFIGVVFGYHKPTHLDDDNTHQYYLFDWRAGTASFDGYTAFEGFRLSKYNGFITREEQKKYFWGNENNPPQRQLLLEKYGGGLGWDPHVKYDLELLYTSNRIRIKIDDEIIFETEGCFGAGKFGLYCMSQDYTRFENFTYQNIVDFVPVPPNVCVGEVINFKCFDLACSDFPDFVESLEWDFGDGLTSSTINPDHIFTDEGEYSVALQMNTIDGCVDTVVKNVTVKPFPLVDIGSDTIVPSCSNIEFDAGNQGSEYLWSNGSNTQTIQLEKVFKDTTVWVAVDKNGCLAGDTVFIGVEPIQEMLYYPNAFTPNGDGQNDEFRAVGNTDNIFSYSLLIFNRWGQLIYESNDPNAGWDGRYNGEPMPADTYIYRAIYRIESSCIVGQDFSEMATVTIVY
jgi:gliding motility-associated-like protein